MKPDNILIGNTESTQKIIYLIDFGLSHSYIDPLTNQHMSHPLKVNFKGSISYCSKNLLEKKCNYILINFLDPSRRDDLESLIYVILYLLNGELPWHKGTWELKGQTRLNFVIKMK